MDDNHKARYAQLLTFLLLPLFYALFYGRYGINETDGGFITGLAWQLISGKVLYADVVYVRPPLPVWIRAVELLLLPDSWAVWGERLLFYLKVAVYCALGAALVVPAGRARWQVTVLSFLLSAHHYPAAAWHTVDGLLCGSLGLWLLFRSSKYSTTLGGGVLLGAAMLCKQSFYPMALIGIGMASWAYSWRHGVVAGVGTALSWSALAIYLIGTDLWSSFWNMTSGAASPEQAFQHGVVDYFRIRAWVAIASALLLIAAVWFSSRRSCSRLACITWILWLIGLGTVFIWEIQRNGQFTVPFAQIRLLFWVSNVYALWRGWRNEWPSSFSARYWALAALSWCAALSWGYNLPILFSVPWAFALWDISRKACILPSSIARYASLIAYTGVFFVFYQGYKWIYRDGHRSEMTVSLGRIFPALSGIYTTPHKAALYAELAHLAKRYAPNFTVLPSFPQANFLTRTRPPLPLDWVVRREIGRCEGLVEAEAHRQKPTFFLEKTALPSLHTNPELALVRRLYLSGQVIEETAHFIVFRLP
ncbi:MAG: hypothetical protein NZM43_12385 [Saprospiraceae bacterium]|nr:hypothetical protein [Saprospiraceae bacterium]MDW8485110.1 hypothetical protein [Saprospiraceae bacterium]